MKNIFLFLVALFFHSKISAQEFSGGVRTGMSYWLSFQTDKGIQSLAGQNNTWDKEIFLRYHAKRRFAMEMSMEHYSFNNDLTSFYQNRNCDDCASYEYAKESSSNFGFNISFQYDLSLNVLKSCAELKNFKSYVGLDVITTLSKNQYEGIVYGGGWDPIPRTYYNNRNNTYSIWTGLSHVLVYDVNDKFYLSSKTSISFDPFNTFNSFSALNSPYVAYGRIGLRIGAGYKF